MKKLKHPFLCKKLVEGGINDEKLILYNYLLSMQRKEYDLLLSKNKTVTISSATIFFRGIVWIYLGRYQTDMCL